MEIAAAFLRFPWRKPYEFLKDAADKRGQREARGMETSAFLALPFHIACGGDYSISDTNSAMRRSPSRMFSLLVA